MRRGFTLIELLVVLGMIAVLTAAVGTAVTKARTRAKISKAMQETREMTNAILAYEQYAPGRTLSGKVNASWSECNKNSMSIILGGEKGENGKVIPILYNAPLTGEKMLDPWGRPYEYMIATAGVGSGTGVPPLKTAPALPNFFRLTDEERK